LNFYEDHIDYEGEKLYYDYIKKLCTDFHEAKTKKYIEGDKYIDYPFGFYIDFLKNLESGKYKIVE